MNVSVEDALPQLPTIRVKPDPSRPTAGTVKGVRLDRSVCIQPANGKGLTVGELRQMIWHLPDDATALVDGKDIKFATPYNGVLYLDTGVNLLPPCPACGSWGCDCPRGQDA